MAAAVFVFAENRHEGLRECALRKHATQQVRQLEGDKESVVAMPAPKMRAINTSRTKARMRETSVRLLMAARALSRFMPCPLEMRTRNYQMLRIDRGAPCQ